jgi:poly(hydroxyalkanoate) depolymerase family esterase
VNTFVSFLIGFVVLFSSCSQVPIRSLSSLQIDYDGPLEHELYVPEKLDRSKPAPLFVALHGCTQNGEIMMKLGDWQKVADKYGFVVLAPSQPMSHNPNRCWNWHLDKNQKRGSGELAELMSMIDSVKKSLMISADRVYVTGLAAGGVQAANLAAAYPDKISGVAIHSGLPYGALKVRGYGSSLRLNMFEAGITMARINEVLFTPKPTSVASDLPHSAKDFSGPVMIIHGEKDRVHNIVHHSRIEKSFFGEDSPIHEEVIEGPNQDRNKLRVFTNDQGVESVSIVVDDLGNSWSGGKEGIKGLQGHMSWFDDFGNSKTFKSTESLWRFFDHAHQRKVSGRGSCIAHLNSILGFN